MGSHSETLGTTMKTLLLLLFPLAFALPAQDPLAQLETNEDFVIGSSCTIEAIDGDDNLDEGTLDKCGDCFEKADSVERPRHARLSIFPPSTKSARFGSSPPLRLRRMCSSASLRLSSSLTATARFDRE